jgi:4-hydroxybenzoate polyprenyltransferase
VTDNLAKALTRPKPLVVDLDGTLVRSDLLIETAFAELGRRPASVLEIFAALLKGKAALKHKIAGMGGFDPSVLPYDQVVLDVIAEARAEGRPVYLASASTARLVEAVAEHLGVFTGWFASDENNNLSGRSKADHLVATFGERGFDYIGNDKPDLLVWPQADKALTVRADASVRRRLAKVHNDIVHLESTAPTLKTWIKLFRVHQYAKNALIFVPLATSHSFGLGSIWAAGLAFVAYSLCASGVYVLNDLVDLAADRGHPTKRNRPLANGSVPLLQAVWTVPLLLFAGLAIGAAVSWPFLAVLVGYLGLTTSYSFYLKRKMLIDVVVLALLYTVRVVGGAVAVEVELSPWLLAFSMFIFTALALMKRFIELAARLDANLSDPSNRNYRIGDLDVVMALAAAAGFNAVTVLALYISSDKVGELYSRPHMLWAVCPLLMYWIGRALMMAHRRLVDDDPIVFAIKDRVSRYVIVCIMIVAALAV